MDKFFADMFSISKPKSKPKLVDRLYEVPKKESAMNAPMFINGVKNHTHQADLLELPDDNGYHMALVVTDVSTRLTDAIPLKTKTSKEVKKAFEKIYNRKRNKILSIPSVIETDGGKEFLGDVRKYFESKNVTIKEKIPGRHRQLAMVERRNQIIGKAIFERQTAQELLTDETSKEWVNDLPTIIKYMNQRTEIQNKTRPKPTTDIRCEGIACEVLKRGTLVRVALDYPIRIGKMMLADKDNNIETKTIKEHGKFRSGDVRFSPTPTRIKDIIITPGQPVMYTLQDPKYKNAQYTRLQLQVVKSNEEKPDYNLIETNYINKILDYRFNKTTKKKEYLVDWRGKPASLRTWQTKESLGNDRVLDHFDRIISEKKGIKPIVEAPKKRGRPARK